MSSFESDDKLSGLVERLKQLYLTLAATSNGYDIEAITEARTLLADPSRIEDAVNTVTLILDMNYHTAISKARSTARQIVEALSTPEGSDR